MAKRFHQWAALGLVCVGVGSGLRSGAQPPLPPPAFGPDISDVHKPKPATDAEYDNAIVASLHRLARDSWEGPDCLAALLSRHPKLVDARIDRKGRKPLGDEGHTALHHAASAGNTWAVAVLLAYKADVNGHSGAWWTPLHHAASAGRLDVVKQLVAAGAKVDAKTAALPVSPIPSGMAGAGQQFAPAVPAYTALDLAKAGKHAAVVEYLETLSR